MTFDPDQNLKRIADEISDDNYGRPSVLKQIAWALESIARSMNADFETLEDHRDNFNAAMAAFRQKNPPSEP